MFPINYRVYNRLDELPIDNWSKISKESSLLPLVKRGIPPKDLINVWYDLQDQYTKRYGTTHDYESYIKLIKKAVNLKCKFVESGQRYLLNEIERLDIDIAAKQTNTHPMELHKILPKMSKYYGYTINGRISTQEFYDLLNNMNNG